MTVIDRSFLQIDDLDGDLTIIVGRLVDAGERSEVDFVQYSIADLLETFRCLFAARIRPAE